MATHKITEGYTPKKHEPDNYTWNPGQKAVVKAYGFLLSTLREFLSLEGFTEVRLPGIHFGKNEKADAFDMDFFGKEARLSSSNSLFLDIYAVQLQKAFSIQRCFRAEKNMTFRHLSEFDLLEVAAIDCSLEDTRKEVERLIKFVLDKFEESPFAALSPLNFTDIKEKEFPVIPYRQLENRYQLEGKPVGDYEIEVARDGPVFVIHLPREVASWTSLPVEKKYTCTFNLLLPGVGEGVEGNQKQTDMDVFRSKLEITGMEKQLGWYHKMIPYSNFLLSGFGLGVERLAMWILGLKHIRDLHPIYRDDDFSELRER